MEDEDDDAALVGRRKSNSRQSHLRHDAAAAAEGCDRSIANRRRHEPLSKEWGPRIQHSRYLMVRLSLWTTRVVLVHNTYTLSRQYVLFLRCLGVPLDVNFVHFAHFATLSMYKEVINSEKKTLFVTN